MATLNFNANDIEPSVGFDAIPAGKYQAVIAESEMRPTKAGNGQYLWLEFEIIAGDFKGRKLWSRLNLENQNQDTVRIARADLSAICRAVNVMTPRDSVELHNLPMTITVRCKKTLTRKSSMRSRVTAPGSLSAPRRPQQRRSKQEPMPPRRGQEGDSNHEKTLHPSLYRSFLCLCRTGGRQGRCDIPQQRSGVSRRIHQAAAGLHAGNRRR